MFRAWNTNFGEAEINSASETGARAEKQLDRVLGFALDVGLLGYGAVNLGREDLHSVYVAAFGAAFLALTVASLSYLLVRVPAPERRGKLADLFPRNRGPDRT